MQEMQKMQVQSPGSGRYPREENGNPLHYTCLENSMDKGAWLVIVHGVTHMQAHLEMSYMRMSL